MNDINQTIKGLELAQIGWVVQDIQKAIDFLSGTFGTSFPPPKRVRQEDVNMTYYDRWARAEWLTTEAYNGVVFIELVQPLSGNSIFRDYLEEHSEGGIQHLAYRLPVSDFDKVTGELRNQGHRVISEVKNPIAKMIFFDTYAKLGVATEIMGITEEGWKMIEEMKKR